MTFTVISLTFKILIWIIKQFLGRHLKLFDFAHHRILLYWCFEFIYRIFYSNLTCHCVTLCHPIKMPMIRSMKKNSLFKELSCGLSHRACLSRSKKNLSFISCFYFPQPGLLLRVLDGPGHSYLRSFVSWGGQHVSFFVSLKRFSLSLSLFFSRSLIHTFACHIIHSSAASSELF